MPAGVKTGIEFQNVVLGVLHEAEQPVQKSIGGVVEFRILGSIESQLIDQISAALNYEQIVFGSGVSMLRRLCSTILIAAGWPPTRSGRVD
jgi:hypothetical protein